MRKTTLILAGVIVGLGLAAVLVLKAYRVDLIQVVVEHAVLAKAPEGYPEVRVRQQFDENLRTAKNRGRETIYLDSLLRASQRLEKIQRLDAPQLDALLQELEQAAGG